MAIAVKRSLRFGVYTEFFGHTEAFLKDNG